VIDVSVAVLACCSCCKERLLTAEADLNKLHDEGAPAHQIEHAEEVVAARQVQEFILEPCTTVASKPGWVLNDGTIWHY
jgi:hypothetical protein